MDDSECCVLSGRGLHEGSIPRPEESYRVCVCVCVCVSLSVIMCNNKPLNLQFHGSVHHIAVNEKTNLMQRS